MSSESALLPAGDDDFEDEPVESDDSWSTKGTVIFLCVFVAVLWVACFVLSSLGVTALLRITAS